MTVDNVNNNALVTQGKVLSLLVYWSSSLSEIAYISSELL